MIDSNPFSPVCLLQAGEIKLDEIILENLKDPSSAAADNEKMGSFKKVLTTPAVHLLAFLVLFYVGMEITMGGMLAVVITIYLSYVRPDDGCLFFLT